MKISGKQSFKLKIKTTNKKTISKNDLQNPIFKKQS